ncbi:MAG: hypothetical protein HYV63_29965 [Candidatus Schekmanbacteria bacterium]|nr:hypothetical protein [Candidatus Schekmanbacteria bacterium]
MNGGASAHRPLLLNHNHDVALMQDGRLVVLGLGKRVDYLAYDDARHELTATPPDFALRDLAAAYYQLAYSEFGDGTYR